MLRQKVRSQLIRLYSSKQPRNALPFEQKDQSPSVGDKVYVAMSGGVDSSVAAAILARDGHDVEGIFMRNWTDDSKSPGGCSSDRDWRDVQAVAAKIGIPVSRIDLSREYWLRVFEPALRKYDIGDTPNPDIACNREVKFGALIDKLERKQIFESKRRRWWLTTGHYARIVRDARASTTYLMRSADLNKDQTYFLSTITRSALARCYFPLYRYTKVQVRALAEELGLPTAKKKDSQGLCFVSPQTPHFREFLSSYLSPRTVKYVDARGELLATDNRGFWSHTIGERSGLQLPQGNPELQGKWYVSNKDQSAGTIELVKGAEHPSLYKLGATSSDWTWLHYLEGQEALTVQLRHRQEPVPCIVALHTDHCLTILFQEAQRSVAPGQHMAIYAGDICLGGGTIEQGVVSLDGRAPVEQSIEKLPDAMPRHNLMQRERRFQNF